MGWAMKDEIFASLAMTGGANVRARTEHGSLRGAPPPAAVCLLRIAGSPNRARRGSSQIQWMLTRWLTFLNSGSPVTMVAVRSIAQASRKQSAYEMLKSALYSAAW